jgi:hypothetical protein
MNCTVDQRDLLLYNNIFGATGGRSIVLAWAAAALQSKGGHRARQQRSSRRQQRHTGLGRSIGRGGKRVADTGGREGNARPWMALVAWPLLVDGGETERGRGGFRCGTQGGRVEQARGSRSAAGQEAERRGVRASARVCEHGRGAGAAREADGCESAGGRAVRLRARRRPEVGDSLASGAQVVSRRREELREMGGSTDYVGPRRVREKWKVLLRIGLKKETGQKKEGGKERFFLF